MAEIEAVVPPPTAATAQEKAPDNNTVTTQVDPKTLEFEKLKQELDAERKGREQERASWQAEKSKPATDVMSFSFDDAFENPVAYFKEKHNLDEAQVLDLVKSVLYSKYPDKKEPGWDTKLNDFKYKKLEKRISERDSKIAEEAKAKAEEAAASEFHKRVQSEFSSAASEWTKAEKDPVAQEKLWWSRQFFDTEEEYLGAMLNMAGEVAGQKKAIPTVTEVQDALEQFLERRYQRYKAKQKKEAEGTPIASKQTDADTLTVKPPPGQAVEPSTPEERYRKAIEALSGKIK